MEKEQQISQPVPDFGALLESVRENGRLMREAAERDSQKWNERFAQWKQERLEREKKWEQERIEREKKWKKERIEREKKWKKERIEREKKWKKERIEHEKKCERERLRREEEREKERKEAQRIMRKSDDNINKMINMFTTQWGKLVEALCAPAALKLFKKSGIGIDRIYQECARAKDPEDGHDVMEIDVLYENCQVMVAAEVKTTCSKSDVDEFIDKMKRFKENFPTFADKIVYGALAAIKYNQGAAEYARKKGLFVLTFSGEDTFTMKEPAVRTMF